MHSDTNLINIYNPFSQLEKSRDIEDLDYEKLNIYQYFSNYNKFLKAFTSETSSKENERIDIFIKCLCKMFIGHNIHQKINNEISKKTNLLILKGDLFISLGYYRVSQMGNPTLIRLYSIISQNFAENIFCLQNFVKSLKGNATNEFQYLNLLVKKYVGLVYYGCSGIRELHQNFLLSHCSDISREFSFKYGLLLFLRTELAFLKEKSMEYYVGFN
jgi:hypothetical protein